ncbi:MAG: mannose-6-phosphate isomerase, class I [Chlorobi bacterium]|nr:mannose-6-phosphate isomerase, class I [Chlorobiota bacterium]
MLGKKPYKLYNSIQHYEWGTKGESAFIPDFIGIEPDDKPYAELWIGAHPKLSSKIEINNELVELRKAIDDYPTEILGKRVCRKFNNKLPFLLKVLSARKALSIQTHPNKEQAEELHLSDPANYYDNNHKPEIAVVLTKLDALLGFRSYDEISKNLNIYPQIKEFLGEEVISNFEQPVNEDAVKNIFTGLMLKSSDEVALKKCIDSIDKAIQQKDDISKDERLFSILKNEYGYDIGLLAIFFLNHVQLNKDEAIFTDAGIPHAYLEGDIVECMANSDNVVRAGLTPKFKDVNTLLKILNYDKSKSILTPEKIGDIINYSPPIDEFKIEKIGIEKKQQELSTNNQVEILLVIKGKITVFTGDNSNISFKKGEAFLIPAVVDQYTIESENSAVIFRVLIP